jgi:mercuric ion transport protein
MKDPLLIAGVTGTIIAAVCCFTPLVAWAMAIGGLAAYVGWIDYVAVPMLGIFVAMTLIALVRRRNLPEPESE